MAQSERTTQLLSSMSDKERDLLNMFSPGRVAVGLSPKVAALPQAQLILSFAVNLLARLSPVVQELKIVVPDGIPLVATLPKWTDNYLDRHVRQLLQALNPPIRWFVDSSPVPISEYSLQVGPAAAFGNDSVWIGCDGWEATISPEDNVPISENTNPVGAYSAACLGVAEIWKHLLYPHRHRFTGTPIIPSSRAFSFSSFSYRTGEENTNPPLPLQLDIGNLTIVGLGAGGGATAFTLASITGLAGNITQVDPDEIVENNLNRYVFADEGDSDANRAKVEVTKRLFSGHPHVFIRSLYGSYDEVAGKLNHEDYRYVISAVHSRTARRVLQYETPMVLWDAGATSQGDFFIWRHILGSTDCMWCKHPPGDEDPEQQKAQQLNQLIDLGVATWKNKIQNNELFTSEEIAVMHPIHEESEDSFDLPIPGQRYGDWEASQCGKLPLLDSDEEIPVPFAPVMAGVLLAGEVLKQHYFPEAILDSYYWNTLMGKFMRSNRPYRRTASIECQFCTEPTYLAQYGRRWEVKR